MKFALILTILSATFTRSSAQTVNTDAIDHFWQVVDRLGQDHPLDDSLWNAYYNLPGNRDYMTKNRWSGQVQEHRHYLSIVFRPSLQDSLNILVQHTESASPDDILDNLRYIKAHEQVLRAYTKEVSSPEYLKHCIQLARQYLPNGTYRPIPDNLTIYIMAMGFDGAVQDSSMYFGLARVYEYGRYRKYALAGHEMHHLQRQEKQIHKPLSSADSASLSAIREINNEGSADLIDKILLLDNPGKVFRGTNTVHRLIDRAPATIHILDSCFLVNAKGGLVAEKQLDEIMSYSSGHLPGMYMADIIRKNGMEKQQIAHNDDPFQFFFLYNAAAARDKRHPVQFSAQTIRYLHALEQRCY